jgi:hypothetical protein
LDQNLFEVDGELVGNYNRSLELIIGKRTSLKSFHVDKRGESPEIEEELGKNYLQTSPAHRYMIVVSPNQKDSGLNHEEFSFDHRVIDILYNNFLSAISIVTRVDSLYGELDDGIRAYQSIEDLLSLRNVKVVLHTPSKFIRKSKELQGLVRQLEEDPELLIAQDSAVLKRIYNLVGEVGDVRGYDITNVEGTREIHTFFTRLFNGVYVFRDYDKRRRPEPMKRPGSKRQSKRVKIDDYNSRSINTQVVYSDCGFLPEDGPLVKFVKIDDTAQVVDFLVKHGYAEYDGGLIEPRLTRLEDESLLDFGLDVANLSEEQRQQSLVQYKGNMAEEWKYLGELERNLTKGYELPELLKEAPPGAKKILLSAKKDGHSVTFLVENFLTKLWPLDFKKMSQYNPRDLEHAFENSSKPRQDYIIKVVRAIETKT